MCTRAPIAARPARRRPPRRTARSQLPVDGSDNSNNSYNDNSSSYDNSNDYGKLCQRRRLAVYDSPLDSGRQSGGILSVPTLGYMMLLTSGQPSLSSQLSLFQSYLYHVICIMLCYPWRRDAAAYVYVSVYGYTRHAGKVWLRSLRPPKMRQPAPPIRLGAHASETTRAPLSMWVTDAVYDACRFFAWCSRIAKNPACRHRCFHGLGHMHVQCFECSHRPATKPAFPLRLTNIHNSLYRHM